jgi:hypothetical protein
MNVTRSALQSCEDCRIYEPNNRTDIALGREPVNGNTFIISRFVFANYVERESFASIFKDALGLLSLF